jgi:alpha-1,6-mannosyltransferase
VIKGVKLKARSSLTSINLALIALGSALLVLYRYGLQAEGQGVSYIEWFIKLALVQSTLYFAAALIVWRVPPSRSTLIIVLLFAGLFRASILFAPPMLSDDIYRYIWDGRVQAAGINPYRYVPADEALLGLRDTAVYPHINRRDTAHTIYPPVAQMFYFLVTRVSQSVTWMKAAMVGCEAVTLIALILLLVSFGWPGQRVLVFAWHPLLVWEIAGSGHVDALMIALLALALLAWRKEKNQTVAGVALACATLIKFFPLVLFPALYRPWNWKMPLAFVLTILLAYAPYAGVGPIGALGFLPVYAEHEGIESGERFFLLALARRVISGEIPTSVYMIFALGLMGFIAAWFLWRAQRSERDYLTSSCALGAAVTVLLAPHYAWYFAWLVPFICFVPTVALFYLTAASFALYWTWLGDAPQRLLAINAFLYVPFALLGALTVAAGYATRWRSRRDERSPRRQDGEKTI